MRWVWLGSGLIPPAAGWLRVGTDAPDPAIPYLPLAGDGSARALVPAVAVTIAARMPGLAADARISPPGVTITAGVLAPVVLAGAGAVVPRAGVRVESPAPAFTADPVARIPVVTVQVLARAPAGSASLHSSQAPRQLRGISYRAGEGDGRQRVRCAVDTFLRVGEIADVGGGETLVVRELVYWIDPQQAMMEVVGW